MGRKKRYKTVAFITCIVIGIMSYGRVFAAEAPVNGHFHLKDDICCGAESTDVVIQRNEQCYKCNIGTVSYTVLSTSWTGPYYLKGCTHKPNGRDEYGTKNQNTRATCTYCGSWTYTATYPNSLMLCGGF